MDIYEYIKNRRSVRKFLDIPVEWDKLALMIDAAKSSPTAGNIQGWKFVVVTNKETIKKIADAALRQIWLETAPVIIVVCNDVNRYSKYYGNRGEKLYALQDSSLATANLIMMAEAQDLKTCFVGAFEEEAVKRELSIPDSESVHALVAVGYSDEKLPAPAKLHLRDVVYFETFGNKVRHKSLWPLETHIGKGKEALQVFTSKIKEHGQKIAEKIKEKVQQKQEEKKVEEIPEPPSKTAKPSISPDVLEQIRQIQKKKASDDK